MAVRTDGKYTAVVQVKVSDTALKSQINNITKKVKTVNIKVRADSKEAREQLNKLNQTTTKLNKELDKNSKTTEKVDKGFKNVSHSAKGLGNEFISIFVKVSKFYTVTKIIQSIIGAIDKAREAVVNFDDALTEFKKVSDLRGEALESYTEKLGKLGSTVARTRTEMVDASTEFKKGGFSDQDSAKLAQVASLYQNIADSELTAGESASFIISQMKAFNVEVDDAINIIDAVNEVKYLPSPLET